jgi:Lamin Tail Domain/Putative metal-binding motif
MRAFLLGLPLLLACADKTGDTGAGTGTDGIDADGDGFAGLDDCDDDDATINPAQDELCDGIDNNCDGVTDGSDAVDAAQWYVDSDDDGQGDSSTATTACEATDGQTSNGDDCDDTDDSNYLGAEERCDDVDNDCDGDIDESDAVDSLVWYQDSDGDRYGDPDSSVNACDVPEGYAGDDTDCDDTDDSVNSGAAETCDSIDNDCDGDIDEDDAIDALAWYTDNDNDSWGDGLDVSWSCEQPSGTVATSGDCDDETADVSPDATEVCDDIDNNCDGTVDEGTAADAGTWYNDADADGWGDAGFGTLSCTQPSGFVATPGDCDDGVATTSPDSSELCDGADNNCDGDVDEDSAVDATTWYSDNDADGYGDPDLGAASCSAPSGTVADATDCDDTDSGAFPGATETCDEADNDCNGTIDDDATDASTWYEDADEDGYGLASSSTTACELPPGYVSDATDCDDSSDLAYPGGTEVCDSIDNDCDGASDEPDAEDAVVLYLDGDGDGYGISDSTTTSCDALSGWAELSGDCDDSDGTSNPGATETPQDGVDQDCDGSDAPYSVSDLGEGDLVITEIMQNPAAVTDTMGEWFEVVNRTGGQVDLDGLYVYDLGTEQITLTGELLVEAGETIVLGRVDDTSTNGGVTLDYTYGTKFTLSNTDDEIYLSESSAKAVVIDAVAYDGGPLFPDPSGSSMSLDPDAYDHELNDDGANWCEASSAFGEGDYGTPNATNDICATSAEP